MSVYRSPRIKKHGPSTGCRWGGVRLQAVPGSPHSQRRGGQRSGRQSGHPFSIDPPRIRELATRSQSGQTCFFVMHTPGRLPSCLDSIRPRARCPYRPRPRQGSWLRRRSTSRTRSSAARMRVFLLSWLHELGDAHVAQVDLLDAVFGVHLHAEVRCGRVLAVITFHGWSLSQRRLSASSLIAVHQ